MEDMHKDTSDGETEDRGGAPIDRGWAWMVVLGTFLIYLIHPSFFYFTSVLFLDFIEVFDTSATMVTLILAMTNVSYCISTLVLVNLVMPIMSVRKLTTISCIVYSVTNWAVVVTPNLPVFFVVCVIKYTAQGGVLVPPLTLVGHYFERRRALATSLSLLGISVASITVPPLTRYIRNEYGFRGCFLLLSAYEMQAIVAAMLLRPLSSYSKKPKAKSQQFPTKEQVEVDTNDDEQKVQVLESTGQTTQRSTTRNTQHPSQSVKLLPPENRASEVKLTKQVVNLVTEKLENDCLNTSKKCGKKDDLLCVANGHYPDIKHSPNGETSKRNTDSLQTDNNTSLPSTMPHKQTDEKRSLKDESSLESSEAELSQIKLIELKEFSVCQSRVGNSEFPLDTDQGACNEANLLGMGDSNKQNKGETKRPSEPFCDSDASFHSDKTLSQYVETNFKSKLFADDLPELDSLIKSKDDAKILCAKTTAKRPFFAQSLKLIRSALDFSLLRNYLAILYLFTFGLHHSSVFLATYVPPYAVKVGVSQQNAAILLTIVGTCDGVSRVAYGYFADLHLVRPSRVLATLYMFLGVVCQLSSQFTSLEGLVFLAVSYGCCGLSHLSLNAPLIVDLLGVEHLGKIFALGALTSSVFISVQFPLHGVLIGATGSFVASFHWIGATFMLSSLCLLSEPVVRRLEGKREKKRNSGGTLDLK